MRILVSGASGLVGDHLLAHLVREGHTVVALSRAPDRHLWPRGVVAVAWDAQGPLPPVQADAVVNLAGERVIGRRWSKAQVRRLRDSRLGPTLRLVEWARHAGARVLVSASAAGYYGIRPEGPCPETRAPGEDVLARLCVDWEAAAHAFPGRVAVLRLGHVLSPLGGYLKEVLPYARLGLAGPIAGGRQPMPWVHAEDVARAILWVLEGKAEGAYNAASPGSAGGTQREFAQALGRALRRPQLPVPGLALRLRYGAGAAPVLMGGQDLRPERLQAHGFSFAHDGLEETLGGLLRR
ncbi:MAG TPA: TIGR01777 family oxidoreductase [Candidatus Thermoplasmatota archaeon]|nr:TIGR01777 family oxidoreductase [Candidatus Thermoplasmatota archaeon]